MVICYQQFMASQQLLGVWELALFTCKDWGPVYSTIMLIFIMIFLMINQRNKLINMNKK